MPGPALTRGDRGPEVRRLQDLMNRTGRMLALDGDFGPGTARAVAACRDLAGLAGPGPQGDVDDALWDWLEARPEPSDFISCEGVAFIAREEIGSVAAYERLHAHPEWPGERSGITIGVGYDLQFQDDTFEADWGGVLLAEALDRLRPCLGVRGSRGMADGLAGVEIPFAAAWHVYTRRTIPRFVGVAREAFPAIDGLPDLCRAALVSLVFNRGGSLAPGDRRREMRDIRAATDAGDLDAVPALFESMARLWPDTRGLRERRFREAALWRRGMAAG